MASLASSTSATNNSRERPSHVMTGFLLVQLIIGYEWLISGVVKFVRGGFPAGLSEELSKKVPEMAAWYGRFITNVVIPNGVVAGYAIEIAELLAGVALIGGPLIALFAWDRVSDRVRTLVLLAVAVASIGGAVLAINLHLANAGSHPWLLPSDPNDEGIDLDSVLPAMQIVIATISIMQLRRLRRSNANHDLPLRS